MTSLRPAILIFVSFLFLNNASAQWVHVSTGLPGNDGVPSLSSIGNNIFAGTEHIQTITGRGVYISTDNGALWTQTSFILGPVPLALAGYGNNVFAGCWFSGIYLSTDNGTSWGQTPINNRTVRALIISGNNIYAGADLYGVYLSTNNGASWQQTGLNSLSVYSLAINGNNVFAGTDYSGVYISSNNGSSWNQTTLNNRKVSALVLNGTNVFAGTDSNGVYRSTDNGTSWNQTSLNNVTINVMAIYNNNIFVGTNNSGIYVSNNNGATWFQRNEGLGMINVWSLCISNNYIFAGIIQGGVYRRPLSELVGIVPVSNQVPLHFSLSQNYPNPFNPSTKIRLDIPPSKGDWGMTIKLSVYDVLGKEVETLINQQLQPGTYEVEWDAAKFSSGLYFYTVKAGDFTETKRMVLIK